MADISKITLPSGTTYNLKDSYARELIEELENYTDYLGVTTTELVDGVTTSPVIVINGESVTAKKGNIAIYGKSEFIYSGTVWQEFGDMSALGALAYKDSAQASYTPVGTVSTPTFTGSSSTFTGKFTPTGSVTLTNSNKTATVAPTTGTATYTPEGNVSAPTISVGTAGSTTTIKNPTSVTVAKTVVAAAPGATSPANNLTYYSVVDETLSLYQLGYTTGASITTDNVTVKNGDATYTASQPEFTGTGVRLVTGNIAVPTSAAFTGTEGDVSISGIPSGTVSQPTFTGTSATITSE